MSGARPDTWMPLYIGDYLADTMHLTRDQHGAYLLLIFAYWRRGGPLPDNDAQLAAIAKATFTEWRRGLRGLMASFFQIADGAWRHKRVDEELAEAERLSNRGRAGGRASSEQRANKTPTKLQQDANETPTKAEPNPNPLPSPSPSPKESSPHTPPRKRGSRVRVLDPEQQKQFGEFYAAFPLHVAVANAETAFLKALSFASSEQITAGAKRYAAECVGQEPRFISHPATWLNAKRWLDEGASAANGHDISERRRPSGPPPEDYNARLQVVGRD